MNTITEQFNQLLKKLHSMGYPPDQIRQIIRDSVGTTQIESLTLTQGEQLIKTLEEHVVFASKSRWNRR